MLPKIEEHDGLRFEMPTWDPTPVEWNKAGSWAKNVAVTDQILAGLREALTKAGFDEVALVKEALASKRTEIDHTCKTYWGSHGCYRQKGHPGLCVCGETGDECSAILKWGVNDIAILWWAETDEDGAEVTGFSLSSLGWTWSP
jgi:hypothetical protein